MVGFQNALMEGLAHPGTPAHYRMHLPLPSKAEQEQGVVAQAFSQEQFNALIQPVQCRAMLELVKLHRGKRRAAEVEAEAMLQRGPDTTAPDGAADGVPSADWQSRYTW